MYYDPEIEPTHPTDAGAPTFAAVADPEEPTDVNHTDDAASLKKKKRNKGKSGQGKAGMHRDDEHAGKENVAGEEKDGVVHLQGGHGGGKGGKGHGGSVGEGAGTHGGAGGGPGTGGRGKLKLEGEGGDANAVEHGRGGKGKPGHVSNAQNAGKPAHTGHGGHGGHQHQRLADESSEHGAPLVRQDADNMKEVDTDLLHALTDNAPGLQRILAAGENLLTPRGYSPSEHSANSSYQPKEAGESGVPPMGQTASCPPFMERASAKSSPKALNEVKPQTAKGVKPRTPLQKHCDFFDPDDDSVIWPLDTLAGFWVLGFPWFLCVFAMFAIHIPFSLPTAPHFPLPDPLFRIFIKNIEKAKHGSDSGAYDHDGDFDNDAFEKVFERHSKTHKDALTSAELFAMIARNRVIYDFFGWGAGLFEWICVYIMLWPQDNLFRKDEIRGVYDGSLFYECAKLTKWHGRWTPPGWESTVDGTKNQ